MRRQRRSRRWWTLGTVVAVAALVALTVVLATHGGGGGSDGTFEQIRPVEITGTSLAAYTAGQADPAIGQPAPKVSGRTIGGTPVSIKPGKPTMLVFVTHWSADAQTEVAALVQWHHAHLTPAALNVVSVASSTDPTKPNYPTSDWLVRAEWPWRVLADDASSSTLAAFGFQVAPAIVMIDSSGLVRYRASGVVPIDQVVAQVNALLAG